MARKTKLTAEVQRLRTAIERAAHDTEMLADGLDAALAGLPKNASKGTRSHLTTLAARARASALGLGLELRQEQPDPKFAGGFAAIARWTAGAVGLALAAGVFQPVGNDIRERLVEAVSTVEVSAAEVENDSRIPLTAEERLCLTALAEPMLRSGNPHPVERRKNRALASALRWPESKTNSTIDALVAKFARHGVSGQYGSDGLDRRDRIVDFAVSTGLIGDADLESLPATSRKASSN